MALSGCSLSKKLTPLKYEAGIWPRMDASERFSSLAAIQPRLKISGTSINHQVSNSMAWAQ